MRMTDILDKDKEKMLAVLSGGKTPAEAVSYIMKELDRILLITNSEEKDPGCQNAATHMIEALKAFVPSIDGIGDTRLWEREVSERRKKKETDLLFLILLILSLLFLIGTIVFMAMANTEEVLKGFMGAGAFAVYILPVICCLLFFVAGMRLSSEKKSAPAKKEQKIEVFVDGEKICRVLHAAFLVIDRELDSVRQEQDTAVKDRQYENLTDREIDLYSSILEAGYSSEDQSLSECTENLRYFLHEKGIETVEYSKEHSGYFEMMPGHGPATIRPALTKDGNLLRRGAAVE